TAWEAGADFVKIFPCGQVGGAAYIRALKGPLPDVPLVPTGGVNLDTAADFLAAGGGAVGGGGGGGGKSGEGRGGVGGGVGVGGELIQKEAVKSRFAELLSGLAAQFVSIVRSARS